MKFRDVLALPWYGTKTGLCLSASGGAEILRFRRTSISHADYVCTFYFVQHATNMISRVGSTVLRQTRPQTRLRGHTAPGSIASLSRLLSSLAVLEQRDGKLNHGSLSAVTAAQKLGGPITGFVAGNNVKSVAEEASKVAGLDKIIAVDNEAYDKVTSSLGTYLGDLV